MYLGSNISGIQILLIDIQINVQWLMCAYACDGMANMYLARNLNIELIVSTA